jgi:ABC-2 type transport system permease protein
VVKKSPSMKLQKYLTILKISFQQEFAYKFNFVMWRVRNVIQVFIAFYFWDTLFSDSGRVVFGYDRAKILTYVFAILFIRSIVLSARAVDIAGQISNGELSNLLLKPVNFFKYWFARDISSKVLNVGFAFVETFLLYLILRPPIFLQTTPINLMGSMVFVLLAILLFYFLLFITNMVAFWMPENGWAAQFLIIGIITEFFSGGVFPLNIFPKGAQIVFGYLPFQYLLYFPVQVYLGNATGAEIAKGFVVVVFWIMTLYFMATKIWLRGIKNYASEGR